MSEMTISFFDCAPVLREAPLSVMPAAVKEQIITVKRTAQTAYIYMEKAARRLTRWITVTAGSFCRTVARKVCAFVRSAVCTSGVRILRKSAILRF